MTDIKRNNYATGQFLTAVDFNREQTYHRGLRQVHNTNLHTWGVGNGLDVTKVDDTHVQVGPGAALDAMGRDIVLFDPLTLDLAAQVTSAQLYLVIAYQELQDPADKVQIGGVDAYVATTERPAFSFVDPGVDANGAPNPAADKALALALLTLDSGKVSSIDATRRPMAGSVLPQSVDISRLTVTDNATVNGALLFPRVSTTFDTNANNDGFASIQNWRPGFLDIYGKAEGAMPGGQRGIGLHDVVRVTGALYVDPVEGAPNGNLPGLLNVASNTYIGGELAVVGPATFSSRVIIQAGLIAGGAALHDTTVVTTGYYGGDLTVNGRLLASAKTGYVMDRFVNRLGAALEMGDVVVIGAGSPTLAYGPGDSIPVFEVDLTDAVGDTRVCGVVCEVHGESADGAMRVFSDEERGSMDLTQVGPGQLGHVVTLGAYAACKVDADIAPIAVGDLLTTSSTRGHAQKVLDRPGAIGAIVGKAMAPLASGRGTIPILVTLQ